VFGGYHRRSPGAAVSQDQRQSFGEGTQFLLGFLLGLDLQRCIRVTDLSRRFISRPYLKRPPTNGVSLRKATFLKDDYPPT
jgi:hypothetical protein